MSIWQEIGDLVERVRRSTAFTVADMVGTIREMFERNREMRRRVAFSVAMIALSAKMAKADGVVTPDEIHAFRDLFHIPAHEERNVLTLYNLAKADVAGFDAYARQMAGLCAHGRANSPMLEDVLDGLFHIAKADGLLHRLEGEFLHHVATIFRIEEGHYQMIAARHGIGGGDPYAVLGISPDLSFEEVRGHYRRLIMRNHPDKLIARGVPEEFIAIATQRLAAINAAYEQIEKARKAA